MYNDSHGMPITKTGHWLTH